MGYRYNSQEMKQAVEAVIDKIEQNVELKEYYLSGLQHVYRVDGQYLLMLRYSKNKEGHYYFSVPNEFLYNPQRQAFRAHLRETRPDYCPAVVPGERPAGGRGAEQIRAGRWTYTTRKAGR